MAEDSVQAAVTDRVAVGAIVVREPIANNRWIGERWRVDSLVCGAAVGGARRRELLREGPEGTQYLWSGLELRLRPNEAESYYYNLLGNSPRLYVHCEQAPGGEPIPLGISAEYIDAMWSQEFGNDTHAVPMPPEVYRIVEQFVMAHYQPEEPRRKRKRDAVSSGEQGGAP
jgi:hypothetical protein